MLEKEKFTKNTEAIFMWSIIPKLYEWCAHQNPRKIKKKLIWFVFVYQTV